MALYYSDRTFPLADLMPGRSHDYLGERTDLFPTMVTQWTQDLSVVSLITSSPGLSAQTAVLRLNPVFTAYTSKTP